MTLRSTNDILADFGMQDKIKHSTDDVLRDFGLLRDEVTPPEPDAAPRLEPDIAAGLRPAPPAFEIAVPESVQQQEQATIEQARQIVGQPQITPVEQAFEPGAPVKGAIREAPEVEPTFVGALGRGLKMYGKATFPETIGGLLEMMGTAPKGDVAIPSGKLGIGGERIGLEREQTEFQKKLFKKGNEIREKGIETREELIHQYPEWYTDAVNWSNFYHPHMIGRVIGEQLPILGSTVAAAALGTVATGSPVGGVLAAGVVAFGMESSDAYGEAREQGLPPEEAMNVGILVGLSNATLEVVPGMNIVKRLGIGRQFSRALVKTTLKKTLAKAPLRVIEQALLESGTEILQEFNTYQNVIDASGKPFNMDELKQRLIEAGYGGFVLGFFGGGAVQVKTVAGEIIEKQKEPTDEGLREARGEVREPRDEPKVRPEEGKREVEPEAEVPPEVTPEPVKTAKFAGMQEVKGGEAIPSFDLLEDGKVVNTVLTEQAVKDFGAEVPAFEKPPAKPEKQPWEMTFPEFRGKFPAKAEQSKIGEVFIHDKIKGVFPHSGKAESAAHQLIIENALSEGKPVPAEVLADYPDLKAVKPKAEVVYKYCRSCVGGGEKKITTMMDVAKEVSYNEFINTVGSDIVSKQFPKYEWGKGKLLKLKDDYAVSYFKSKYENRPVYILKQSGIEYIFEKVKPKAEPKKVVKAEKVKPAPKKAEPVAMEEAEKVSLKNAAVNRMRKLFNWKALPKADKRTFQGTFDTVMDKEMYLESDARARSIIKNPRDIPDALDVMSMLVRRGILIDERGRSYRDYELLVSEGDIRSAEIVLSQIDAVDEMIDNIDVAARRFGSETAFALVIRKAFAKITEDDYSYAGISDKFRLKKGMELTESEEELARTMARIHEEKEREEAQAIEAEDLITEENNRKSAEKVVKSEVAKARRQTKRAKTRAGLKVEEKQILKDINALGLRFNDITGVTGEGLFLVGKLSVNYIRQGALTLEEVVEKVLEMLPELKKRDVYESLNAHNPKYKKSAESEVNRRIRQIKREGSLKVELENASKGVFKERKVSVDLQINSRIKLLSNNIRELYKIDKVKTETDAIKSGIIPQKAKKLKVEESAELKEMRAEKTELLKILKLKTRIERAKAGEFEEKRTIKPSTREVMELRKILQKLEINTFKSKEYESKKLNSIMFKMREVQDQLAGQYRKIKIDRIPDTEIMKKAKQGMSELMTMMNAVDKISDYQNQLETGNIRVKPPVVPRKLSPELEKIVIEKRHLEKRIRQSIRDMESMTAKAWTAEFAATLRTMRATGDISATFRQGLFLIMHTKVFTSASLRALGGAWAEKNAMLIDYEIENDPDHWRFVKHNLYISPLMEGTLSTREETISGSFLHKIPIYGRFISKPSERHMVTFLNLLRTGVFKEFLDKYPNATDEALDAYASYINWASGRGPLGNFERVAGDLSKGFFALRFATSRPAYLLSAPVLGRKSPIVMKEILKDQAEFVALATTILGLAVLAGATVVVSNPRDPDWLKIKVGNTSYDILGGTQQPMRLLVRAFLGIADKTGLDIMGGKYVSDAEKRMNFYDIVTQFIIYKQSPLISTAVSLIYRETVIGEKIGAGEDLGWIEYIVRNSSPLAWEEAYDATRDAGAIKGVTTGVLALSGVGSATYERNVEKYRRYELFKINALRANGKSKKSKEVRLKWNRRFPEFKITTTDAGKSYKKFTTSKERQIKKLRAEGKDIKADKELKKWNKWYPKRKIRK